MSLSYVLMCFAIGLTVTLFTAAYLFLTRDLGRHPAPRRTWTRQALADSIRRVGREITDGWHQARPSPRPAPPAIVASFYADATPFTEAITSARDMGEHLDDTGELVADLTQRIAQLHLAASDEQRWPWLRPGQYEYPTGELTAICETGP